MKPETSVVGVTGMRVMPLSPPSTLPSCWAITLTEDNTGIIQDFTMKGKIQGPEDTFQMYLYMEDPPKHFKFWSPNKAN